MSINTHSQFPEMLGPSIGPEVSGSRRYPEGTGANQLERELEGLTDRISPAELRASVATIFRCLTELLDKLRLIEPTPGSEPSTPDSAMMPVFSDVRREAIYLVAYLRCEATTIARGNTDVLDVLDGTSYAIKHELDRAFEEDLAVTDGESVGASPFGRIAHAHGLLRNCFEQSIVALACVFDPSFMSAYLLTARHVRLAESLALCKELSALISLGREAERSCDRLSVAALAQGLTLFRYQTMHHLMYRDWDECERMIGEALGACAGAGTVRVLDRFCCYLEVLLAQVKLRAVLRDISH